MIIIHTLGVQLVFLKLVMYFSITVFDKVLMREKTVAHMNAALLKKAAGSRAGGQATGPFQTNTFTTFVPLKETASAQCS